MDASASCKDTADAMKFCRDYKALHEKLNPGWSQSAAQNVFPASAATSAWLGEFHLYEEIYATVEPDTDSCTPAMRQVIKRELGRDVNVQLQLHMAIPKDLVKTCSPTPIGIAIRFHGGGGVRSARHHSLMIVAKEHRLPDIRCLAPGYAEQI